MNRLLNNPDQVVKEMLEGYIANHSDYFTRLKDTQVLIKKTMQDRVSVVIGAGSGNEPWPIGYVGEGLADACALGNVFAAPAARSILNAIRAVPHEKGVICVANLTHGNIFKNVSFELYKGEILGVAGLIGAGRTEVMRAVFGADPYDSGECFLYGKPYHARTPKDTIKKGLGLIPEDRRAQGLLLEKNVKNNTSLAALYAKSRHGFIDFDWEKRGSIEYIQKLGIKTPSELAITKNLSGGNQQKVVIAKWLLAESEILIMDEPTRGIDVNAKSEIYELMKEYVENGGSIILVSSELPEVIGCSNRIMVMREGVVSGFLNESEATEERVMSFASKEAQDMSVEEG